MELTISLPQSTKTQTIKTLLEKEWLIPRKVRHFLRIRKNVFLNGQTAMFHQTVSAGDMICLQFEPDDYQKPVILLGNPLNVQPIWEDEHLIIVNKASGIKTHPNQPDEGGTLLNDVAAYLDKHSQFPYVVHRLDKETSGAILFAKNPIVLPILGRMLEQKEINRLYQAQIKGHLNTNHLTITKKIGRDRHDRRKRIIDSKQGKNAITHIQTIKKDNQTTWIECVLETGRTHQIRVHLASIGHPLVGDPLYNTSKGSSKRLQLHAKELSLIHPFTKERVIAKATPYLFND